MAAGFCNPQNGQLFETGENDKTTRVTGARFWLAGRKSMEMDELRDQPDSRAEEAIDHQHG